MNIPSQPSFNPENARRYDGVADVYDNERVDLRAHSVEKLTSSVLSTYDTPTQANSDTLQSETYEAPVATPEHEMTQLEIIMAMSKNIAHTRETVSVPQADYGKISKSI